MKKEKSKLHDKNEHSMIPFEEYVELFRDIVENMNEGLSLTDENRIITYANPRLHQIFGYSSGELIGMNVQSFISENELNKSKERFLSMKKGNSEPYQIDLIRKDEQKITVRISPRPIFDENNNFKGTVSVLTDITEVKRAEKLIQVQRDLGIALASAIELDEILKLCLDATIEASEMDSGGIYLVDSKSGAIDLILHRGFPPEFINSTKHYEADSKNAQLVMRGGPIYTSHKNLGTPLDDNQMKEELRAIAVVPVCHSGRVIACMNIASHTFSEVPLFSRNSIETIAYQIGAAIAKKQSEIELRESEEKYRNLVDTMSDGFIIIDENSVFTYVNSKFCEQLGYPAEKILGEHLYRFFDDVNRKIMEEQISLRRKGGRSQYEVQWLLKDGSKIHTLVSPRALYDSEEVLKGSFAVITDISDLKKAEEEIRSSLSEKEILLKEIHHRVKNNMQVISSLLSLQSEFVKYDEDRILFDESCSRIRSMASVHEKLYQSKNLSEVNFDDYLQELVSSLYQDYLGKSKDIEIIIESDSIYLGVDRAIPCALIINELVTNSFKYAFDGDKKGILKISFKKNNDTFRLVVSDNGIGISSDINIEDSETLGLKIVSALSSQLDSTVNYDGTAGAQFTIEFEM